MREARRGFPVGGLLSLLWIAMTLPGQTVPTSIDTQPRRGRATRSRAAANASNNRDTMADETAEPTVASVKRAASAEPTRQIKRKAKAAAEVKPKVVADEPEVMLPVVYKPEDSAEPVDSEILENLVGVSKEAVEEELKLQKEREAHEQEQRLAESDAPALIPTFLDLGRFDALEFLLMQSEAFARFISEQVQKTEAEAEKKLRKAAAMFTRKAGRNKRGAPAVAPDGKFLPLLTCDLKDYQVQGIKWLNALYNNGINGILADEMGLGKTVQALGFLSYLKTNKVKGPYLIVAPLSTLTNWVAEFKKFFPSQPTIMYHGPRAQREQMRRELAYTGPIPDDFPAIITSYEMIIADANMLTQMFKFQAIVVDEGHRLKNTHCHLIQALRLFNCDSKLLLTGTPLQNNLAELWSLLNFLMPEIFKNVLDFEEWFNFAGVVGQEGSDEAIIAAEQRTSVISKLHAILKPFVLRRLKSDVNINLPPKMEIVLYAPPTDLQKKYIHMIETGKLKAEMLQLARDSGGSIQAAGNLSNPLMQLRKINNSTDLLTGPIEKNSLLPTVEQMLEQSGKMQLLHRVLTELFKKGHRVLVFSQMTQMIDLLDSYADQLNITTCRLDGKMKIEDRHDNIDAFSKAEGAQLFLLSTRAGGLGINLNQADTVLFYDSDWNPHQDLQAMARCHRLGQTKPVLVLRLAASHSVDGRMLKKAGDKMVLEKLVIKKGAFKKAPSAQEGTSSKPENLTSAELKQMLKGTYMMDDLAQSDFVSDEMLARILDRSHMMAGNGLPYPESGVGYEVVHDMQGADLLEDVNKLS